MCVVCVEMTGLGPCGEGGARLWFRELHQCPPIFKTSVTSLQGL